MQTEKISLEDEVVQQILAGRKVAAIKALRNLRGIGLKESKQLVELYAQQNNIFASKAEKGNISSYVAFIILLIGCYFMFK